MTRRPVDNATVHRILPIMNHDRPNIHKNKQPHVRKLLQWKHKRKNMVWHALREPIKRMESMAGERRRHHPFVVRLVHLLVYLGMMQAAVYPVDERVGEQEEEWELQNVVPATGPRGGGVVDFRVAADFGDEGNDGQDAHEGH